METITISATGGAKGEPGPAAIGVSVVDSADQVVLEHSAAIGNATADFAAYQAVVEAFELVQQHFGTATKDTQFKLILDNEFVKKQLNGEAAVTDPRSVSHFIHAHNLRVDHYPHLQVTQVPRSSNAATQRLVEEVLDGK